MLSRLTEWLDRRFWWNPIFYVDAQIAELERKVEHLSNRIAVATYDRKEVVP